LARKSKACDIDRLISELDGKSETAQEPIIDEIVGCGLAAITPLTDALQSGASYQVRMAAAVALGKICHKRSIKPLMDGLSDTSLNVQRTAAEGLKLLGAEAVDQLLEGLNNTPDEHVVRKWCAEVLGFTGRKSVATDLIKRLPTEVTDVQKAIIVSLGQLGSTRATKPLVEILGSENVDLTRYAAESLGQLADPEGIKALIFCLDSPSIDVRRAATDALVKIGPESVPALTTALTHGNYVVRRWVAEALGRLKDKRAVLPLIESLADDNIRVSRYAALALGEIGDARALDALKKLIKDEDPDVRYSITQAVAGIGGPAAVDALVSALGDDDWVVRVTAARGLGLVADPAVVPPLCEALRDPEWSVRLHAVEALGKLKDR